MNVGPRHSQFVGLRCIEGVALAQTGERSTHRRRQIMSVAKTTEIISSSTTSFDDAMKQGIARATKTLKNVSGAWIQDQKVVIDDGKVTEYRVTMKVTFVLE
jgi:hypothetical protein